MRHRHVEQVCWESHSWDSGPGTVAPDVPSSSLNIGHFNKVSNTCVPHTAEDATVLLPGLDWVLSWARQSVSMLLKAFPPEVERFPSDCHVGSASESECWELSGVPGVPACSQVMVVTSHIANANLYAATRGRNPPLLRSAPQRVVIEEVRLDVVASSCFLVKSKNVFLCRISPF